MAGHFYKIRKRRYAGVVGIITIYLLLFHLFLNIYSKSFLHYILNIIFLTSFIDTDFFDYTNCNSNSLVDEDIIFHMG